MYLRLEIAGHYLEVGKVTAAEEVPTIADRQYPAVTYAADVEEIQHRLGPHWDERDGGMSHCQRGG